ncbi:MAG: hypothetical protein J2P41_00190 [Blastocatellia bacterium]|nr:hypothetical protein [Blastocatellia bacterium]
MARRRTRRRVHARRRHNPVNPVRRRRRANPRRRRASVFMRTRRRHNPIRHHHRRHHRRRRNPLGVSGSQITDFAISGLGLAMFQPIVNRFIGGILPLGQFTSPAVTAISGWGLSKIFGLFNFTRRFEHPTLILGFSTAVIQIVQPYVSNLVGGIGGATAAPVMHGWPQGYSGWNPQRIGRFRYPYRGRAMRGIGVVTGIPPTITAPPAIPTPAPAQAAGAPTGMQGLGMRPGVWAH